MTEQEQAPGGAAVPTPPSHGPAPHVAGRGCVLEGARLRFRYRDASQDAVRDISVRLSPASVCALIGPNGSGKSTLVKLLAGVLAPHAGRAACEGMPLARWKPRDLARRMAVVPQIEHVPFPLSVRSLVAMGRYPHLGPWRRERAEDVRAIDLALARCGLTGLGSRTFQTLSGGEQQRARMARALAQRPRILIVDEPTAALDMRYEMTIFRLLRALADDDRVAVLIVTHNLNLATRFADGILLLKAGSAIAEGPPRQVVTAGNISRAYDWPVTVSAQSFREGSAPQVAPS